MTDVVSCQCEHVRHFPDEYPTLHGYAPGHDYGTRLADARPADVPWQSGDAFCAACLRDCHPGSRWLDQVAAS